jgi:hypothetical protein
VKREGVRGGRWCGLRFFSWDDGRGGIKLKKKTKKTKKKG